jgi:NADH:ubiquinone oxidoreductase subunit 2 (subunit N)
MGGDMDMALIVGLLSLGGLPPLLGFFPKLAALWAIVVQHTTILFVVILGSLLNLGYYLRLIFRDMTLRAYVGDRVTSRVQMG